MSLHWLTLLDEDDEPYGEVCDCPIGEDHDELGQPNGLDLEDADAER